MLDNLITFRVLGKEKVRGQVELCWSHLAQSLSAVRKLLQAPMAAVAYVLERGSRVMGNDLLALRIFSEKLTP